MKENPLDLALRHVFETRSLLESLITSSESFDYIKAKEALLELQKKSRQLAKVQAQLQHERKISSKVRLVQFKGSPQLELELA
jgi:hypothetical protein